MPFRSSDFARLFFRTQLQGSDCQEQNCTMLRSMNSNRRHSTHFVSLPGCQWMLRLGVSSFSYSRATRQHYQNSFLSSLPQSLQSQDADVFSRNLSMGISPGNIGLVSTKVPCPCYGSITDLFSFFLLFLPHTLHCAMRPIVCSFTAQLGRSSLLQDH